MRGGRQTHVHRAKSQRVANALSQVEAEYKVEEFDVTAIEAAEEEREAEIDEDEEAARAADWDEVSGRVAREGVHASWVEAGAAQTAVRRTATFRASGCAGHPASRLQILLQHVLKASLSCLSASPVPPKDQCAGGISAAGGASTGGRAQARGGRPALARGAALALLCAASLHEVIAVQSFVRRQSSDCRCRAVAMGAVIASRT